MSVRTESHIDVEAASWTTLLESGEMSQTQLQTFHRWLEEPLHARALGKYRSMLGMIQDLPRHRTASLIDMPVPHGRFPFLASLFSQPLRLSAITAAVATVVAVGAWQHFPSVREYMTQTYTTGTGEARTIVLPDGSVAYLNTQSTIGWDGSDKERHVVLERGEVLFEVAHDPSHPFRVTVGNSEIQDLATEFDVYRKANGNVVVTVLSGQVAIKEFAAGGTQPAWKERKLNSNEQMEYGQTKLIDDVHPTDASKSVRWREGLLETEGQPLTTLVNELNRYSNKPIVIADQRVKDAHLDIGGTVPIHNVPVALARIQSLQRIDHLDPIVVTDTGKSYVISYKIDGFAPQQSNTAGRP